MEPADWSRLTVSPLTGEERLHQGGKALGFTVTDFWRWSTSDLVSNAMRGVLAEFIVGTALDCIANQVREEWDAADLRTSGGIRIEVKSAAYVQSWHQEKASPIGFSIAPTFGWDSATNVTSERQRQADVYVFCLLHHLDKRTIDPLDVGQWTFFVVPTSRLNQAFGEQKRLSLGALRRFQPDGLSYALLPQAVEVAGSQN